MIYWIQAVALAGAQEEAASSLPSAILSGGVVGAVVGLVGVLVGQYLTQRRHSQTLEQNATLETQRAREAALQKYFEQVGKLLIDHPKNPSLGTVARAQTLAVLEGLDPDRKRILLQFLNESNLIEEENEVISLWDANLAGANLEEANLAGANLEGADLEGALLRLANLGGANLVMVESLSQKQIDGANGDENTKIPYHLRRPAHWRKGDEGPSKEG